MKKAIVMLAVIAASTTLFLRCGEKPAPPTSTETGPSGRLPQDVMVSCTVTQDSFNTWFAGGKVTENGTVLPANSIAFQPNNNCSFYRWSEQMFLWITSPVSGGKYIPGNTVLESPVFYDVTVQENNKRFLTQHTAGKMLRVQAHISQNGPNDLPLVTVENGMTFEVERAAEQGQKKHMLMNASGGVEEIAAIEEDPSGKAIFKNKAGKIIANPKPLLKHKADHIGILAEIKRGDKSILLDSTGAQHTEVGQATGDVMMTQKGDLVYYLMMVNDVYAYYMTACKNGKMDSSRFPTTDSEMHKICAYAREYGNGKVLPDSNALALEIKTSWVETTHLPDSANYIIVSAEVPEYNTSDPKRWVPTGTYRQARLALIGMHVVGSLTNHPEMSWATFEHMNNAPNGAYQYLNKDGKTVNVPAESGTGFLLCENTAKVDTYNISHMKSRGDTIVGNTIKDYKSFDVSPSNTRLTFPYGTQMNTVPNAEDTSSSAANSEVIAINNAVMGMLAGNDMRKNYLLVGATWVNGGTVPSGKSWSKKPVPGSAIGSDLLANSTMETYFQRDSTSCFTCHNSLAPTKLSHIFKTLQPLPAVPKSMK